MIREASRTIDFTQAPRAEAAAATDWSWENPAADVVSVDEQQAARPGSLSRSLRIVGLLAFGQSLLFLVIWLLVCASAGAAPAPKKPEFKPELQVSKYQSTKARDPFGGGVPTVFAGPAPTSSTDVALRLDGILYSADPSAIVNGQILSLNKTVTINTGNGDIKVRATAITRDRVTVEVNGRKMELILNQENASSASAP